MDEQMNGYMISGQMDGWMVHIGIYIGASMNGCSYYKWMDNVSCDNNDVTH